MHLQLGKAVLLLLGCAVMSPGAHAQQQAQMYPYQPLVDRHKMVKKNDRKHPVTKNRSSYS
eukprot:6395392-Amphidinium_carterae.2